MTDTTLSAHLAVPARDAPAAPAAADRFAGNPWMMAPALLPLLIMPLGILFHPEWLIPLAELGTLALFATILRLMRL
ncbi:hypothetical protein [Azospirillum sp. ST 5-10]|uniref:hypothetical protein n=1 Tax=unclassified Azospirillum TaxID=2630922 RepID=UPI003F4A757A